MSGVHEDDLVTGLAVDLEDVLDDAEVAQTVDRRRQLFADFPTDGGVVRLAELDAAADQPVVPVRILLGRGIEADRVRGSVRVGSDEHGLDADAASIDRHLVTLAQTVE